MSVLLEESIKFFPSFLEKTNSLVRDLYNANVPEITGEILMFCENTAYDLNDLEQSAILFEKVYENYAKSNLVDYRDISIACLLKATYSHSSARKSALSFSN